MRIRSIRIKDFRKLTGPVCIDRIGDGITVISGDNEEGKSTVLEAIRSVLFTRHRVSGDAAERMQPFGQSVRPEISLDFEIGGKRYSLRKAFCRRPEAELAWTGGRATGDAAEDELQELLRFVPPGKGAAKARAPGDMGAVLGGPGHLVQGFANERWQPADADQRARRRGWTGPGRRSRAGVAAVDSRAMRGDVHRSPAGLASIYRKSLEAIEALERDVAKAQTALQVYDEKISRLERVRSRLRTYDDERILQRAQDQLRAAEAADQRLTELQDRLRAAQNAVEIARSKRDAMSERWNSRAKRIEAAVRARDDADTAARREAEA